jgi:transposase
MEIMKKGRRKFTGIFKAKVVLEALKEKETLATLSAKYEVSGVIISRWKQDFIAASASVFDNKAESASSSDEEVQALYAKIGQLEVENDFLKKNLRKAGL